MAKSKARAQRRADANAAEEPRIETEAERIVRLRLARMARDAGLLPAPGTPGLARHPNAPIRRVDADPALLNRDAPKLALVNAPKPDRAPPPRPSEAALRQAVAEFEAKHGKPKPVVARPGIPADVAAMLAMLARGSTLAPSQMQRLQHLVASRQR